MVRTRAAKIEGIANSIPPLEVDDPTGHARLLVLGWGSTYGSIGAAVRRARRAGHDVAQAHLRHMNPFPANLGEVLRRYDKVLVPEINLGQLALLLRGKYLVDVISYNRVRGCRSVRLSWLRRLRKCSHMGEKEELIPNGSSRLGPSNWSRTVADSPPRISSRTRRFAGAPAAATTRFSPPSSRSSPSLRCRGRTSS